VFLELRSLDPTYYIWWKYEILLRVAMDIF